MSAAVCKRSAGSPATHWQGLNAARWRSRGCTGTWRWVTGAAARGASDRWSERLRCHVGILQRKRTKPTNESSLCHENITDPAVCVRVTKEKTIRRSEVIMQISSSHSCGWNFSSCFFPIITNPKWNEVSVHCLVQVAGQPGLPLLDHCWLWSSWCSGTCEQQQRQCSAMSGFPLH